GIDSLIDGTSGRSGVRCCRLWPSARKRPLFINPITAGAGVMVHCDSPATTDATEAPPPLYGTWVDCRPASASKATPVRWLCEPAPADAMLRELPLALTQSAHSFMFFAGTLGFTTSTLGVAAYRDMNSKSFSGSYGSCL